MEQQFNHLRDHNRVHLIYVTIMGSTLFVRSLWDVPGPVHGLKIQLFTGFDKLISE